MSSPGWHARAQPFTGTFLPTSDALVLASIHSTPVKPEDLTLALFTPNIAVDARGAALILEQADFDSLKSLSNRAVDPAEVPSPGTFRNQWAIAHPITSRPIDRLLVKNSESFSEVSVSGYEKDKTALRAPVGAITELPAVLYDVFGLILEAREDGPGEPNADLVSKVKELLEGAL
jgi:hypothetical protein